MHVGLEEHEAAAPLLLGLVESEVSVAQGIIRGGAIAREQHDADTGFDGDITALECDRTGDSCNHLAREALDRGPIAAFRNHDRELVAAEAGEEMVLCKNASDQLRNLDEKLVAGGVAERVVDLLEAVEIEQKERAVRACRACSG